MTNSDLSDRLPTEMLTLPQRVAGKALVLVIPPLLATGIIGTMIFSVGVLAYRLDVRDCYEQTQQVGAVLDPATIHWRYTKESCAELLNFLSGMRSGTILLACLPFKYLLLFSFSPAHITA